MSDLYPVAGCRFYIGGQLLSKSTDFVAADFTSQTWVEVDGYENMGAMGDTGALISTQLINRGRDVKQKGTFNAGSRQDTFAIIAGDPGQVALIAASKARNNYAFKVQLNDATDALPVPSQRLFVGLVMGASEQGGGANTVRTLNATIEVNSNIVVIPAAAS